MCLLHVRFIRRKIITTKFLEVLTAETNKTRPSIRDDVLEKMDKATTEEFMGALRDSKYSCRAICMAVESSTGIKVSDNTIRKWRVEAKSV